MPRTSYVPRSRSPLARLRAWWWRWRPRRPLSDGRCYVGWTARIVGYREYWPPVGSQGEITGSETQAGELVHHIAFDDGDGMIGPLPVPGLIELVPPPARPR